MKITSYEEAVKYLERFIGKIIFKVNKEFLKEHDPLERMRVLLGLLGNPQDKFKSVLVGGTSGKGSTAYLISHILTTAGYKTGFTLSPHLQKVNERLQINGESISDKEFTKMVTSMIRIIESMKKMKVGAPSYFEILVGMAFKYFADQKVDIAVVEVGMGGEFDATNTLNPLIAVLTNVGLDHTNILGNTVEKIAKTKAGIIKKNKESRVMNQGEDHNSRFMIHDSTMVSGVKQPSVIKIVADRCEDVGVKLNLLWRDFGYKIKKESAFGIEFDFISKDENLEDLKLSLLGEYQAENASLAIKTILELKKFGFKVTDETIKKALKKAFFPGRFEVLKCHPEFISGSPARRQVSLRSNEMLKPASQRGEQVQHDKGTTIVLDGAHNPVKMREFLKSLKKIFPNERKVFIVGFKFDKDIPKMLREITKVADEIIVTEFNRATDMNMHASADALDLKSKILNLKPDAKVMVEKDSKKALRRALAIKQPARHRLSPQATAGGYNNSTIIVITGSLYLVGEIRNML